MACLCMLGFIGAAGADDKKTSVPDGTPAELQQFIQKTMRSGRNAEAFKSVAAAADKILAHKDATPAQKVTACTAKVQALYFASRTDKSMEQAFNDFCGQCIKDFPKTEASAMASAYQIVGKHMQGQSFDAAAGPEILAHLKDYPKNMLGGSLAQMFANSLERKGDQKAAEDFLNQAVAALGTGQAAESLKGTLRRMKMMGSELELSGPTLTGSEVNLKSYKGKVVLVDFWATWCGPCVGELPNVKKVYEKYHAKGFDIIGVSLDRERSALENFVKAQEMPWTQIIFNDPKDMFWNNPLARKYGINSIPATFLVGRDGKVCKQNLRGEEALEKAVASELAKSAPGLAN